MVYLLTKQGTATRNLNGDQKMTNTNQVTVTNFQSQSWVNVDFNGKNVQFYLLNSEKSELGIKDAVAMGFSICSNIDEIENHCKLNGVVLSYDDTF